MTHQFFQGMSKTAITKEIRDLLSSHRNNEEFDSALLSDLIVEKHYYCSKHNLRPIRFRKTRRKGGGYNFEAYFPGHGWHCVSWTQCLNPRNKRTWVRQILRDAVNPIISKYRNEHPRCERCGNRPSQEVDHVNPEFHEILENALQRITDESLSSIIENADWWSKKAFTLSPDNPALLYTLQVHETAVLQALCRDCHKKVTRLRKKSNASSS